MTGEIAKGGWLAGLRQVFSTLFRQRHVAVIEPGRAGAQKLEPIAKILSDTGRDRGAQLD